MGEAIEQRGGHLGVSEHDTRVQCPPIALDRHWQYYFYFSGGSVALGRSFGYPRMGKNYSHSIVPGGFDVTS